MEHRDWLASFGVEHLGAALSAQLRRVVVADLGESTDDGETPGDLVADMCCPPRWMRTPATL
ncbi:putative site-specific integrase-resolvase [Actinopolymorpha pittospori]|uniref:Site-specific integrase-resolvase n=1 Tax=Actinopolymorpha pittospori TaxID=648752 RepID=A0A927N110_9ACTN|nr:putative site-specific integrase-resolvase [Actinopolymorpha pittospori]